MTDELNTMKQQIVAAVQQQLTQYSEQVRSTVQALRDEIAAERAARSQSDEQVLALAAGLERSQQSNTGFQSELQGVLEERLTEFGTSTKRRHEEMNTRLDRVVDEANTGLEAAVESVSRPILRELEHRQTKVEGDLVGLDKSIRKFDDQAALMVAHINDVTSNVDGRIEQLAVGVAADVEIQTGGVAARLDEVSAQSARHQSEVSNIVGQSVDEAESRMNDKIATAEARITEEVGSRIAEIDAYVGRVSVGLDEGIVMLNDRFSDVNTRFEGTTQQIAAMEQNLKDVDVEALDEMKDRVRSVAGEAELVRIEMDRFQATMGDAMDKSAIRLTEVETHLQDQALDTETAVQLERLEEVERALIALDPAQFVRVDDVRNSSTHAAGSAVSTTPAGFDADFSTSPPSASLSTPSKAEATDSMASFGPPAGS
jgi:hypothetical protein